MAPRPSYLVLSAALLVFACAGGEEDPGAPPQATTSPTSSGGGSAGTGESTQPPTSQPSTADACTPFAGLPTRAGTLAEYLAGAQIIRDAGEGFTEPAGTELVAFERAFEQLVREPSLEDVQALATFGFTATLFKDAAGGAYLIFEDTIAQRGAGTFVVNLQPARDLWLESPHADSDEGTLTQAADQLVALGARAYLVTGANRCASSAETPCDGKSSMCGGQLRTADAAHYDRNFFTAAHRGLRAAFPNGVAVNVHGMDVDGDEAAVISDGTRAARPDALSVRLRDAMNRRLPPPLLAFACNDPADDGLYRPLCGTTNVQGRVDNGATDACRAASPAGSDRFLHLEQANEVRTAAAGSELSLAVIEALGEVVPCSLGGSGVGCVQTTPVCQ